MVFYSAVLGQSCCHPIPPHWLTILDTGDDRTAVVMVMAILSSCMCHCVILSLLCIQSHFITSITMKSMDFEVCFPCKETDASRGKVSYLKGGSRK